MISIDAIQVKIRDGQIAKRPVYTVIGVTVDGMRDILGLWVEYSERPIADEDLDRILEAGRRAPSSRNRQQWDFVLVTKRGLLQELAKVWRGAGHVAGAAAAIALIAPIEAADWRRESSSLISARRR